VSARDRRVRFAIISARLSLARARTERKVAKDFTLTRTSRAVCRAEAVARISRQLTQITPMLVRARDLESEDKTDKTEIRVKQKSSSVSERGELCRITGLREKLL